MPRKPRTPVSLGPFLPEGRQCRWFGREAVKSCSQPGQNRARKRAHACCATIGRWVIHYATLRFQPGPKRFAGRSTMNSLLPADRGRDQHSEDPTRAEVPRRRTASPSPSVPIFVPPLDVIPCEMQSLAQRLPP